MLTSIRAKLNTPGAQYAIAGAAISVGVRRLVELTRASRADLDELVELHAETRTRVFALETIEEGRRSLEPAPDLLDYDALRRYADDRERDEIPTNQPTEEAEQ